MERKAEAGQLAKRKRSTRRDEERRSYLHDLLEESLGRLAEYGVSFGVGDEAGSGEEDVSSRFGGPSSESARRGRERSRQVES